MDHQNPRVSGKRTAAALAPEPVDAELDGARTREIRAEIEQTRDDMSETVNAIQDRLRPGTLASNAAESLKHAALDTVRDVAESDSVMYVRSNPTAVTMLGIGVAGLAWLAFGSQTPRSSREGARRSARGQFDDAAARHEFGADLGGRSPARQDLATYARDTAERTWDRSPMVVGAACAVVGAMVALAIPATERENELMGETRDQMLDTVQTAVHEKASGLKQAATEAVDTIQQAATRSVDRTSEGAMRAKRELGVRGVLDTSGD